MHIHPHFIAALFRVARIWEQPGAHQQVNQYLSICRGEVHTSIAVGQSSPYVKWFENCI